MSRATRRWLWALAALGVVLAAVWAPRPAGAITVAPEFAADYTAYDLGPVPGVPSPYGGLTLLRGEPNKLLIGGNANYSNGALYVVDVTRDGDGHITGFSGTASPYLNAPYNDGGVVYGPNDVLFTSRWPVNELGQYIPGSPAAPNPDKVTDLYGVGVAYSHAALNFVPPGFSGAGQMKMVSWPSGQFYTAQFSDDGLGTFTIDSATYEMSFGSSLGPEGFVYVAPGSSQFLVESMLVSEWSGDTVGVYEIDAEGNPILSTRRDFLSDLDGAEGAFIDPVTGDFLFSTWWGGYVDHVYAIRGFQPPPVEPQPEPEPVIPEPLSAALLLMGLGALARRRAR